MPPHFPPNTEEEDARAEHPWPDGYKKVLRQEVARKVVSRLASARSFSKLFSKSYSRFFPDYDSFIDRLCEMAAIGAENGADHAFDHLHEAFEIDAPLPNPSRFAVYHEPDLLSENGRRKVIKAISEEYAKEPVYRHLFEHYSGQFKTMEGFMKAVAAFVAAGALNGADHTLGRIYNSLYQGLPLPAVRRNPKRLKP